jgi:hypothetical protein
MFTARVSGKRVDGFAAYRKSEVLLHMDGNPTYQDLISVSGCRRFDS